MVLELSAHQSSIPNHATLSGKKRKTFRFLICSGIIFWKIETVPLRCPPILLVRIFYFFQWSTLQQKGGHFFQEFLNKKGGKEQFSSIFQAFSRNGEEHPGRKFPVDIWVDSRNKKQVPKFPGDISVPKFHGDLEGEGHICKGCYWKIKTGFFFREP